MKLKPLALLLTATVLAGTLPVLAADRPIEHTFIAADASTHRIAEIEPSGAIRWETRIGDIHDLHLLPDGHLLFQRDLQHLVEWDPKTGQEVWSYDASRMNGNEGKPVQVHAFQRLSDGTTMIAESGPARIIEVDRDGRIVHQIKLKVEHPGVHTDTRLVRKLRNGHYLVCHEADGTVRDYDRDGNVLWEYAVPLFGQERRAGHGPEAWGNSCFAAVRLANGNTLISTGNGHGILEVTPEKQIVWQITQKELPGITLAWVTTLQVLPNGHIVLGNCHAGPDNPQLVEITREKQVVWTYKDFHNFGNALSNSEIVDGSRRSLR